MAPWPRSVDRDSTSLIASPSGSPLSYFLWVFALSIPLWLIGGITGLQLFEGLPASALNAFCPLIAAVILTHRTNGTEGTRELLKRSFDYDRIRNKAWYIPILFLMPGTMVLSYELMRWMALPLPVPRFSVPAAVAMFVAFFIGAVGEEVGWSGYVIDRIQLRWNAFTASALLGVVWAVWHIVPYAQAHRSPAWIAWQCFYTVAARIIIVWLYNNTGNSVFATILHHAISNVSVFMYPNFGSHYDPRITGLLTAFAAAIVTVVWGPRTLSRSPSSSVSTVIHPNG
jgi:uncharacterized protein